MMIAGCANMDARRALTGPVPIEPAGVVDLTSYEAAKARAAATQTAVPAFVHEGEAAAMASCLVWFKTISDFEAVGSLQLQEFNILAATGMTAAGLASANGPIIASLGAGIAALNGLADANLKAVLAPSSFAVQEKVIGSMNAAIAELEPLIFFLSYPEAQSRLRQIETLCQPPAIRAMIAQSLGATTTTFDARGQMRTMPRSAP
jgi:hypothetical protein